MTNTPEAQALIREPMRPANTLRHPPGCPDADWCRGANACYWDCAGNRYAEMLLPAGKTCADCAHGPRCEALFQAVSQKFTSCDFWPSSFRAVEAFIRGDAE